MKKSLARTCLAVYCLLYVLPGVSSDKLPEQASTPRSASSEEKNQGWTGQLMPQATDLVDLVNNLDIEKRSKELDEFVAEGTKTSELSPEKETFARKHRNSLLAFQAKQTQEDSGLAAMELAAYEVAYAQLIRTPKEAWQERQ